MASTIDELTINYEEDGLLKVKELDKVVLTKGAWSTLMYKFQDWDFRKEEYGPVKYTIRRYQKRNDAYRQQSKFNISNNKQAKMIIDILENWISEEEGAEAEKPDTTDSAESK
ncbi:MAG: hypothetical protein COA79_00110 [Planctomycetota bacterium]|nr:MAG: hypothetical protein COA79_00110 [Planctomycetota bacterium]